MKEQSVCARCGAWRGVLGLEPTPALYVEHMVEVFREVRRVLRSDGTLWLNLGDCYATGAGKVGEHPGGGAQGERWKAPSDKSTLRGNGHVGGGPKLKSRGTHTADNSGKAGPRIAAMGPMTQPNRMPQPGLKPKDLAGIPWTVAFALRADGWWLRQALPWVKRNPMPESAKDRPTTATETVFLLSKSETYHYDYEAVKRRASPGTHARLAQDIDRQVGSFRANGGSKTNGPMKAVRNKSAAPGSGIKDNTSMDGALAVMPELRAFRNADLFFDSIESPFGAISLPSGEIIAFDTVTEGYSEAHFATFPPKLTVPMIIAGCPRGGTVLDPFGGAGTTGLVADRLGRNAALIELNADYCEMARRRIHDDAPLLVRAAE